MSKARYRVILVHSTSHAIRGENLLSRAGIESKLIPVPRTISSDCGVCLRIDPQDEERAQLVLEDGRLEIDGIHQI